MRRRIFINPLQNREQVNEKRNRTQKHYERLILICFGGGVLGFLLGLALLFSFDAAGKNDAWLKYRALIVIFSAALMFGCGAHLMDKSDDEKKRIRKLRFGGLARKEIL